MTKANFGVGMAVMGHVPLISRSWIQFISITVVKKKQKDICLPSEKNLCQTMISSFINSIEKPRRIMLMVQAGPGTDTDNSNTLPHLDKVVS